MTKKIEAKIGARKGRGRPRKEAAKRVEKIAEKPDEFKRAKNAPSEEYLEAWKRGWEQVENSFYVAILERVEEAILDDRVRGLVAGRAACYDMALEYVSRYGATRYAEVANEVETK